MNFTVPAIGGERFSRRSQNGRPDALEAWAQVVWEDGFQKLRAGTLVPQAQARAVHAAETVESNAGSMLQGKLLIEYYDCSVSPRVPKVWEEGFRLLETGTLDPMQFIHQVRAAEAQTSGESIGHSRRDFLNKLWAERKRL